MAVKPAEHEKAIFAFQECIRIKQREEQSARNIQAQEKKTLKELHCMRYSKCAMLLVEIYWRIINVDYRTSCGGVWLDAGGLERISGFDASAIHKILTIFR